MPVVQHPSANKQTKAIAASTSPASAIVQPVVAAIGTLLLLLAAFGVVRTAEAAQFPACHAVPVEAKIIRDFNWAEKNTWNRGYLLARLSGAHEHRTRIFDESIVTRRYCMAKAHFTNGDHRTVYFMVSDIGGFVGRNWDVTHCVMGLEPWRNHGGNCRTMR